MPVEHPQIQAFPEPLGRVRRVSRWTIGLSHWWCHFVSLQALDCILSMYLEPMWHGDPQELRLYIRAGDHLLRTPIIYLPKCARLMSQILVFLKKVCVPGKLVHFESHIPFSSSVKSVHGGRQTICESQMCSWEIRALWVRFFFSPRFPSKLVCPESQSLVFLVTVVHFAHILCFFPGESAPCVPDF